MATIQTVVSVIEDERSPQSAKADLKKRKSREETLEVLKSAFPASPKQSEGDSRED